MNLGVEAQILKQAELRELRKTERSKDTAQTSRAPKPLEAKWRLNVGRSPLCEGCGGKPSGTSGGSKVWKCGPCVRAVEDAYIRAMERQELLFQKKQEEILGKGINNLRLQEDNERGRRETSRLQGLLHDSEMGRASTNAQVQQLMSHIDDLRAQHARMLEVQDQMLAENASLHHATQTANQELERSGYVSRDLEHANNLLREENQRLQDRIEVLLQTVSTLREELRGSFKASEQASQNLSAERREWQTTVSTLQAENEDLRRRLAWLEKLDRQERPSASAASTSRPMTWSELRNGGTPDGGAEGGKYKGR